MTLVLARCAWSTPLKEAVIVTDHGFFLNAQAEAGDVCVKPQGKWTGECTRPHDAESGVTGVKEQHFTIIYGDTEHSYESIMGPYLQGAKTVTIEDPYIRLQHQIQNFVRFCETVLRAGTVKKIHLITGYDDNNQLADIAIELPETVFFRFAVGAKRVCK